MRIRINWTTFTTEKFVALFLALVIIFILINEITKFLQKRAKSSKADYTIAKLFYIIFLVIAGFLLLKFCFR